MGKLKIAIYTRSFPPKGGGISTAHYQLYELLKVDYEVKIFVFDELENNTSPFVIKRKTITWINKTLEFILKLKYRTKKRDLKLINLSRIISVFIPIIRLNKHLKDFKPHVIIVPDNFLPAYFLKKPKESKLIWFAHHNYNRFMSQPLLNHNDWLDLQIAYSMELKALKKVDVVISPSLYMIRRFKDTTYKGKRLIHIPNFINEPQFKEVLKLQPLYQFPENKKVVYIPSAGSDIKGKRYVFEIIRRLLAEDENVFFYLSGHIPSDLHFELQSRKDYIYAPGHLSWQDNMQLIKQAHIGITPNIEENFSYAILEGQAVGVPFVAFDTGGNNEVVMNDETGFIVPFLDIENLIIKALLLLRNDNLQKSFNHQSRQRALKEFGRHVSLIKYKKLLDSITLNQTE